MSTRRSRYLGVVALALVLLSNLILVRPAPIQAGGGGFYWGNLYNLRLEMAEAAKKIKDLLAKENAESVALGAFKGPVWIPSTSGPAIVTILGEELKKAGVSVKAGSPYQVDGEFEVYNDTESEELATLLKFRLADKDGQVKTEFKRAAYGTSVLTTLFGLTVKYPLSFDSTERVRRLHEALKTPEVFIKKTKVAQAVDNPFAVEILAKRGDKYVPVEAEEKRGLAFAALQGADAFAIRLFNHADFEAAVTLTIDGLSSFTFSEVMDEKTGQPKMGMVLVPAHGVTTVLGWHRSMSMSERFLWGKYASVPAGELPRLGDTMTVTALFAAAWPKDAEAPRDDPTRNARCGGPVAAFVLKNPVEQAGPDWHKLGVDRWLAHHGWLHHTGGLADLTLPPMIGLLDSPTASPKDPTNGPPTATELDKLLALGGWLSHPMDLAGMALRLSTLPATTNQGRRPPTELDKVLTIGGWASHPAGFLGISIPFTMPSDKQGVPGVEAKPVIAERYVGQNRVAITVRLVK